MEKKFRAWNKINNTMYEFINSPENWSFSFLNQDNFIWLQFTDLLDKNRIEIYEGDIIKYTKHAGYLVEDFIAKICWNPAQSSFGYAYRFKNGLMDIKMFDAFNTHDELRNDFLNHLEIIGNIFQHPELLTPLQ